MTTDTDQQPETGHVETQDGTRLQQLHETYTSLKATAEEVQTQLKAITDALKVELTNACPGATKIDLTGSAPPLRLTYAESWRVDAKKLKREQPETYVRYAKKSGSWTLKAAPGGGGPE